jgi:L-aminopeptidase/D-esterase-like protein
LQTRSIVEYGSRNIETFRPLAQKSVQVVITANDAELTRRAVRRLAELAGIGVL